jgi:hypothetical protein
VDIPFPGHVGHRRIRGQAVSVDTDAFVVRGAGLGTDADVGGVVGTYGGVHERVPAVGVGQDGQLLVDRSGAQIGPRG